jgi:enolase
MMNTLKVDKQTTDSVDVQEFMVVPVEAPSFAEAIRWCAETYQNLKKVLKGRGCNINVGGEGGFAPSLGANEEGERTNTTEDPGPGEVSGIDVLPSPRETNGLPFIGTQ